MQTNLEKLKKIVERKSAAIQNNVLLLESFNDKADPNTQQFINLLLQFHSAIADQAHKNAMISISVGKIVSEQAFDSILQSIITRPSVMVSEHRHNPALMIKNRNDCIVTFNLTDIEIVMINSDKVNDKTFYFVQLHSKHNSIDYSIIITVKEDQ